MNRFQEEFEALFDGHFQRLRRYLDRLSGDPDQADDMAQEAFIRLYRRGSRPDMPEAWLIAVATNLFRNARSKQTRRERLLAKWRESDSVTDPPGSATGGLSGRGPGRRVRAALDRVPERERRLLLLQAEGYSYREIAAALNLNEASVGTLLARAKRVFIDLYEETTDAP